MGQAKSKHKSINFSEFDKPQEIIVAVSPKPEFLSIEKLEIDSKSKSSSMAKFQFQCEELLKILPDLQCQECKDVPGPIGDKKYRYSCLDESHALCEEHKVHVIRFLE